MIPERLKSIYRAGAIAAVLPVIVVLAAYLSGNFLFIDYVHVLLGAIWTGVDVFYGLIFYFVISSLDARTRADIAERLIPMSLFFIPSVSILTPLAGYILAVKQGIWNPYHPVFSVAIITGSILVAVGFMTIVPASALVLKEIRNASSNYERSSRLLMLGSHGALLQLALQIAMISVMAYIVVYM
jgi:hypothetical protein